MVRHDTYVPDGPPRRTYQKAKERKEELRLAGWRAKIRKTTDGLFQVWKKHRDHIDAWNNDHLAGCRQHTRKIPAWRIERCTS